MSSFTKCVLYLAAIGASSFVLGRLVLKHWFCHDKSPYYAAYPEQEEVLYNALRVRKWKEKLPDMSEVFPGLLPSKKLPGSFTSQELPLMVQETCISEWIHGLLSFVGFGCVLIWQKLGGWIVSIIYVLGNLPYIIIQRHNRPKLLRLLARLEEKEAATAASARRGAYEKSSFTELQHRPGA